jgi:hypothetical protein
VEIEELKSKFLNLDFDEREFAVRAEAMVDFATAVGETAAHYTDPNHPEFRAVPTFPARFHGRRMLPEDFPRLGGIPLDAGKAVMPQAPIRAGVTLVGRSHLHEIFEKTGRSGRMIFLVARMEVRGPGDTLVSIVDSRMVIREKPAKEEGEAASEARSEAKPSEVDKSGVKT